MNRPDFEHRALSMTNSREIKRPPKRKISLARGVLPHVLEKINHAFQGEHELHALIRRQFRPVFYTLAAIELGCMEPKDAVQRARLSPYSAAGKNRPLRAEK